jgi:hypothetical protein
MLGPYAKGSTFWAQTCIEPDRIALLARDVSQSVRGGLRGQFIQFDGATPGQLLFSVRTRLPRTELMSFTVDIARLDDGFTNVDAQISDHKPAPRAVPHRTIAIERPPGYGTYKRYAQELAAALTRFDPLSTSILVEKAT